MINPKLTLIKIPLKGFLDILKELYDEGVDYIDLSGSEISGIKDQVNIGVRQEYYSTDRESFDTEEDNKDMDDYLNNIYEAS